VKLSDLSDDEWFARLYRRHLEQQGTIRQWWEYYDGCQPLYYVAKILEEQGDRFPALTINWCQKFIDWMLARTQVEGFRLRGQDVADEALWEIWQRNDMDLDHQENDLATLVPGISYMMVGPGDEGAVLTVESPESAVVEIDTKTRRTTAAAKWWRSDPEQAVEDMSELYLPTPDGRGSRLLTFDGNKKVDEKTQGWMQSAVRLQTSPEVPVVPFMNRRRRYQGRSELVALKPIVDAANQVATNMMAGVEHHAVQRKWALNVLANKFEDEKGQPIPAWKAAMGAVWSLPFDEDNPAAPEPKVGQFSASDLRNFHETISLLARIGAGLCDLAPSEFGVGVADNPPGADGIQAAKESGVRRVERFHIGQGASYEKVMRLAAAVEDDDPSQMVRMETIFRDPSTPTHQAAAQSAVATYGSGISDLRQAREDYGYTVTQIEAMENRANTEADVETQRLLRAGTDVGSTGGA
jgi:hypothetical protein